MPDRRLIDSFGGWAEALLPDVVLQQERATRAVINRDATVDPEAIGTALSVPVYLDIAGALAIGTDIGPRRRVVQAVTVWQVRADVKTAPVGGECTLWLAADGVQVAAVSVSAGEAGGVSSVGVDLEAGALLTVDCATANGAADASIMVATRPRGN